VILGGVAIALLGYAMFPVVVLLLERDVAHGRREHATALLATAGLVTIVPQLSWANDGTRALALAVISAVTFAWLALRNRRLVAQGSATNIALWQNLVAALCLVPFVVFDTPHRVPTLRDLGGLVVLGVFCTGLAHTLFIASMRRVSAQTASVVAALEPVYGIVLAALLLQDVPSARTLTGGVVIVAAAIIASLHPVGGPQRLSVASKPGTAK